MPLRWSSNLFLLRTILFGLALCFPVTQSAAIGFQPVSPEELKMTSEPLAPGAPAIILYHQVDRDDAGLGTMHEDNYLRIKVLTAQGRKYADVELAFLKNLQEIVHINARTIRPDGSIVNFDGKVFEKSLVKARKMGYSAKTFTLPDVEVGGIIEYSYTLNFLGDYIFDSHWILSEDLFTKRAQFSLKPYSNAYSPFSIRWTWHDLPVGSEPQNGPDHIIRMSATNIPAFLTEDFMPPENELKSRVDFIYTDDPMEKDPEKFWQHIAKKRIGLLDSFIGKRKAMEKAVSEIVSPNDPPEIKLHKIYDRVQSIRNKSFEISKTEQEEKRNKEKFDTNVEEVWKRGYGDGDQLTWLYLALVRAAGFEAYGCWVSDRRQYFFNPKTMESAKLNANVVLVKLNGKDLYFDPGAKFTPFGMLTWSETGVQGLRLDKDGGTWITTSLPLSSESRTERNAKLKLSDSGDLEGQATITYVGLDAMYYRQDLQNEDEVARKKALEESLKSQIPLVSEVELRNKPDWNASDKPLVAEFDIKITGWVETAGKRAMVPVGVFTAQERHVFEHGNRVHPVYFEYPYEKWDDITIELPAGWQVSSVPPAKTNDEHAVAYDLKIESDKNTLHLKRKLSVDALLLMQKYYPALRNFFELVRTGDEEQIVLQPGTTSASN